MSKSVRTVATSQSTVDDSSTNYTKTLSASSMAASFIVDESQPSDFLTTLEGEEESIYSFDDAESFDFVMKSRVNYTPDIGSESSYSVSKSHVKVNSVVSSKLEAPTATRFSPPYPAIKEESDSFIPDEKTRFDIVENLSFVNPDINTSLTAMDFTPTHHLCNGSHSCIFKGIYNITIPGIPVVIKALNDNSIKNEVAQRDFDNEIDILSRIRHEHIVELLGFGYLSNNQDDNLRRPVVLLERLDGDTLAYHLSIKRPFHSRPFSKIRYIRMAKEFASALYYLHEKVHSNCIIIHRDLKPDNIAFTIDGSLKLIDFGLSVCLLRSKAHLQGIYELTGCTGSFRYMAPENALNLPYNEKVDIYAFGLILYEIITGVPPFSGYSKEKLYEKVIHGNQRPPLDYDGYGRDVKCSDSVKELLIHCWDPNYINRPTAKTLVEFFTHYETEKMDVYQKEGVMRKAIQLFQKRDTI